MQISRMTRTLSALRENGYATIRAFGTAGGERAFAMAHGTQNALTQLTNHPDSVVVVSHGRGERDLGLIGSSLARSRARPSLELYRARLLAGEKHAPGSTAHVTVDDTDLVAVTLASQMQGGAGVQNTAGLALSLAAQAADTRLIVFAVDPERPFLGKTAMADTARAFVDAVRTAWLYGVEHDVAVVAVGNDLAAQQLMDQIGTHFSNA